MAGKLRLEGNDSYFSGFESNIGLSEDVIWKLPAEDGAADEVLATDGAKNLSWTTKAAPAPYIPSLTDPVDRDNLLALLEKYRAENVGVDIVESYQVHDFGTSVKDYAYAGAVYNPIDNRIYFVPYQMGTEANWHYVDCNTGKYIAYPGASGVGYGAYVGGVYSPTQNRIYFVPYGQGDETAWHYINCEFTYNVTGYSHGMTVVDSGYSGGAYSPTQDRIYFAPYLQGDEANWHYVDCTAASGYTTIVPYTPGVGAVNGAYTGAVYSPTQNRIYFAPSSQGPEATWHYIDCDTGAVVPYTHGATVVQYGYNGGVYSPTQNRIYLTPDSQGAQPTWHYIDCDTGAVVPYAHGITTGGYNYSGGVYSPILNRIYLVFRSGPSMAPGNWHYIDCDTGAVVPYNDSYGSSGYRGGAYSPTENRIYWAPYSTSNLSQWKVFQEYAQPVNRQLMANGIFNGG